MLGYVLDGKLNYAIVGVSAAIMRREADLGMTSPATMLPSAVAPDIAGVKETHHIRPTNSSRFVIHHVFMSAV